jgi:hypothetical protein
MADKSPRQHQSKTSGKTLKQKRAEKKAAHDPTHTSVVPPTRSGN